MNYIIRSWTILFSEVIWIYFLIAIFTGVEWEQIVFVHPFWWVVAAVTGYTCNAILGGRINYILFMFINGLLLIFIVIKNGQIVITEGSIIFTISVSLAVCFTFIRSASFIYKEPTRAQMLMRFEGNVIIYILFSVIFFVNQWEHNGFHLAFLFAIFLSLIGMILTLQSNQIDDEEQYVEVHSIGNSRSFNGIISLFFLSITLLCAVLFLPTVRNMLHVAGIASLDMLTRFFKQIYGLIIAFMNLFSSSTTDGESLRQEEVGPIIANEEDNLTYQIPYEWIIAIISVIGIGILIWVLSRFLKQWQRPNMDKTKGQISFSHSWLSTLLKNIKALVQKIKKQWKKRFSYYYKRPIYWYYHQLQKWGKQHGFRESPSETSKEFIDKIISGLQNQLSTDESTPLVSKLQTFSEDYQRTYYSDHAHNNRNEDYKKLLNELKSLKLNNVDISKEGDVLS